MICRFCLSDSSPEPEQIRFSQATYEEVCFSGLCDAAARRGHVFCLEHSHFLGAKWDEDTCYYAAKCGNLNCLIYLHEHGCPWDCMTCIGAAREGHLDCLMYAHKNGCPLYYEDLCTCEASSPGRDEDMKCLKIIHEETWKCSHKMFECFRYAVDNGCVISSETLEIIREINSYIERSRNQIEEIFGKDIGNMIIDMLRISSTVT